MNLAGAPGIAYLAVVAAPTHLDRFWSVQLILAMVLNALLQAVQVGAYAARLAGVQTGRIGTSISLFNLFVTASRFANMFYAPLLGSISDQAGRTVLAAPGLAAAQATQFEWQIRGIVASGSIGTIAGAILLPTFVYLFVRGVGAFERRGSIPRSLARLGDPKVLVAVVRTIRLPSLGLFRRFSFRDVPLKLLIGNVVVTAIQAIAVVAAYEASVLRPDVARTALSASGARQRHRDDRVRRDRRSDVGLHRRSSRTRRADRRERPLDGLLSRADVRARHARFATDPLSRRRLYRRRRALRVRVALKDDR